MGIRRFIGVVWLFNKDPDNNSVIVQKYFSDVARHISLISAKTGN